MRLALDHFTSCDPCGKVISATGTLANVNPLRCRGYVYDQETGFYYLQSRYYDPAIGRFLNADSYASTGQGIIGCNMFTYCGNNVASNKDATGFKYVCAEFIDGGRYDLVIYYSHPESNANLEKPARRNHSNYGTSFIGVSSFDELAQAVNSASGYVNNVYLGYLSATVGMGLAPDLCVSRGSSRFVSKNAGRIRTNFKCLSHASPCLQGEGGIRSRQLVIIKSPANSQKPNNRLVPPRLGLYRPLVPAASLPYP